MFGVLIVTCPVYNHWNPIHEHLLYNEILVWIGIYTKYIKLLISQIVLLYFIFIIYFSRLSGDSTKSEMLHREKKYNKGIIGKIRTKLVKSSSVDDANMNLDYRVGKHILFFLY